MRALKPIRSINAKRQIYLDHSGVPSETSNGASQTPPKSTPCLLLVPNFFQATGLIPISATARFGLLCSSMSNKLVRSPVLGAPREMTCCAFMTKGVESWNVDTPVREYCKWGASTVQDWKSTYQSKHQSLTAHPTPMYRHRNHWPSIRAGSRRLDHLYEDRQKIHVCQAKHL